MSSPTIASNNLHGLNESIAANLATAFPTTPKRTTPNSAKKRRQMPDLSRPTATPGHGAKMSMIFRDAATSLQGSRLPMYQASSNIKRRRLPSSQARSIKFGSTCPDDTIVSSTLQSPLKISQYLGKSCEPEWASSDVSRHRVSGVGPYSPRQTPLTKAGRATLGTLGATTDMPDVCLADTLSVSVASLPSPIEEEGKEPISSGFVTPVAPTPNLVEKPENMQYPILEDVRSLRSSSDASILGSDSDDLDFDHSMPFKLPFPHSDAEEAPRSQIDSWLEGIVNATTSGFSRSPKRCEGRGDLLIDDASFPRRMTPNLSTPIRTQLSPSKSKQDLQSPSGASSDKENISPFKNSFSPTPPGKPQTRTPSRVHQTDILPTLQSTKTLRFVRPLTPQGYLSLPPKRKRACVDRVASSRTEKETLTARKDFTIHEDQLAEALTQLSPDIERYRKGRGPRRARCMSYWDEDILQPGSQCVPMDVDDNDGTMGKGKQLLGELSQTIGSTMKRPPVEEAGSRSFDAKA